MQRVRWSSDSLPACHHLASHRGTEPGFCPGKGDYRTVVHKMKTRVFSLLVLAAAILSPVMSRLEDTATACNATCTLPCLCSGTTTPYGWAPTDVPQMILVVFQGSINAQTYSTYYKPVFSGLSNPNGCPAVGTFFLSHKYTDYTAVNAIYDEHHDLGVQSLTGTIYQNDDATTVYNEIAGEKLYIEKFANLPTGSVRGVQAPSLCPDGNNMFEAIARAGLSYDQSLSSKAKAAPYWPYTLDYLTTQDVQVTCPNAAGPTNSYPGITEFPLNDYRGDWGALCSSLSGCVYGKNITDGYTLLTSNFARYTSQSTPFLINVDLPWLMANSSNAADLNRFLKEQLGTGNTYVITLNQAVDWFEHPVKLSDIAAIPSWSCADRSAPCSPLRCVYKVSGSSVNMDVCEDNVSECPSSYPWIDNLPWLTGNK